jgi:hypothetical protein
MQPSCRNGKSGRAWRRRRPGRASRGGQNAGQRGVCCQGLRAGPGALHQGDRTRAKRSLLLQPQRDASGAQAGGVGAGGCAGGGAGRAKQRKEPLAARSRVCGVRATSGSAPGLRKVCGADRAQRCGGRGAEGARQAQGGGARHGRGAGGRGGAAGAQEARSGASAGARAQVRRKNYRFSDSYFSLQVWRLRG